MKQSLISCFYSTFKKTIAQDEFYSLQAFSLKTQLRNICSKNDFVLKIGVLTLLLSSVISIHAQDFKPGVELFDNKTMIPFQAVDFDKDGDLDLVGGNIITFQSFILFENIAGSNTKPDFDTTPITVFDKEFETQSLLGSLIDIDADGDLDFLSSYFDQSSNTSTLSLLENNSNSTEFNFSELQLNPYNIILPINSPLTLTDFDKDGDIDILIALFKEEENYYSIDLIENIGSKTSPEFGPQLEILSLGNELAPVVITSSDLDSDGDIDLLLYENFNEDRSFYIENIGNSDEPEFGIPQLYPFGVDPEFRNAVFVPGDFDNDGDQDFIYYSFIFNVKSTFSYYENVLINSVNEIETEITLYPNPASQQILWNTTEQISSVRVLTVSGAEVMNKQLNRNSIQIDHLKPGNYIIELTNFNGEKKSLSFQKI